jgi:aspartyl-tRNA(Asn)/glutamyl-tRNA(Gln) amidotransferase subunit A
VPLGVKDVFDTAGLVTTYGSTLFVDHVPSETAVAVQRLERAGYANVGKTNLHEFAYGVTSANPHFGTVPNPIAPARMAGGSSGGSAAALAAGLVEAALGSDSGGSIRIPAACCGIVGLKPTFDLVSLEGCWPLAPSFDHAGPMSRDVGTCVELMGALVDGFEPAALDSPGDVKVGVAWIDRADPLIARRVAEAAATFRQARRVELPLPEGVGPLFMREVAEVHSGLFPEQADAYGEDVRTKLERCIAVTEAEAARARRHREEYRERVEEACTGLDLILTPTLPFVAPRLPVKDEEIRDATIRFTFPLNCLGWPALALPCGPAEDDLPASLQLVGRAGDDALVLAAGLLVERALAAPGNTSK